MGKSFARQFVRRVRVLLDPRRSFNCHDQYKLSWTERAEQAVDLLAAFRYDTGAEKVAIADFACGNCRLETILADHLGRPFEYSGYDLHPQTGEAQGIDLREGLPPGPFDVVFCLGLVEYIPDTETFARRLRAVTDSTVMSYVFTDSADRLTQAERELRGWRNHHSRVELERLFTGAGFSLVTSAVTNAGRTGLWLWTADAGGCRAT